MTAEEKKALLAEQNAKSTTETATANPKDYSRFRQSAETRGADVVLDAISHETFQYRTKEGVDVVDESVIKVFFKDGTDCLVPLKVVKNLPASYMVVSNGKVTTSVPAVMIENWNEKNQKWYVQSFTFSTREIKVYAENLG